jgi:hypothetical protein
MICLSIMFFMEPEEYKCLKAEAQRRGSSVAELIHSDEDFDQIHATRRIKP